MKLLLPFCSPGVFVVGLNCTGELVLLQIAKKHAKSHCKKFKDCLLFFLTLLIVRLTLSHCANPIAMIFCRELIF